MLQPTLDVIPTSRSMIDVFGGYNHNVKIAENEFYNMKNMSAVNYPTLSPRVKRGVYPFPEKTLDNSPQGLIAKDALCYVDGEDFVINNYRVEMGLSTDEEMCPKQLVSMGAYVIIMPDKKYINTIIDDGRYEYGNIEQKNVTSTDVTYSMCKVDGASYESYITSETAPLDPNNKDLWMDTSSSPHALKQYSADQDMWVSIATTYLKIKAQNIAAGLKKYDGVNISGISDRITQLNDYNNKVSILQDVYHTESGVDDYVVITGVLDEVTVQEEPLTLYRYMPKLDFLFEANNRLWGCRYGEDISGNIVNEIYASKQGDFKNWNCFMGLSTDSYSASCGSDGQWTGAINHLGYPVFFKETCLHKVFGSYPANYQIQSTACRGVLKGCGNSLAIVNERLLYKSADGVCVYDGSLPTEISTVFGNIHYNAIDTEVTDEWQKLRCGAVAGAFNNKYYISMRSEIDGKWYFFVYDMQTGLWHKEDETRVDSFCACRDEMYFIDHKDKLIKTVLGSGSAIEDKPIEWFAESGVIGTSLPDKKYISRLLLRMALALNTHIIISIEYDSCGSWEQAYTAVGTHLRSFAIPIKPRRCDHFRLRIEGKGEAKIYSIVKTIEQGSDI